jgi:hypothetical protein
VASRPADAWPSVMVIRAWVEPDAPLPGTRIRLTFTAGASDADSESVVATTAADALDIIADWLAAMPGGKPAA